MKVKKLLIVALVTALFPYLFYESYLGANLLIFNILVFVGLYFIGRLDLRRGLNRVVLLGTFLTSLFVVYNGSDLAIALNIFSLFLLAGSSLYPKGRNLFYVSLLSVINFFVAQIKFFTVLQEPFSDIRGIRKFIRFLKIIIIPLVIVFFFVIIYKLANPIFEGMVKSIFDVINNFADRIFEHVDIPLTMTFVFGFVLANYFFIGNANKAIVELDKNSSDKLVRKHKNHFSKFRIMGLKSEYTSALLLFAMLNILILVINVIDIWWVWFNFEWEGEYLKQFVHEGTYLLILSIIISLAISIYYFRGNINFLKNNSLLRKLAYIWLAQNAILTISVGVRNFWYINYFSLAYLRIGVIFFLFLTLFSIYTVFVKIKDRKSTYYLFRKNSVAAYVLLVIMAFFNWDTIIAKYNFSHAETAFIHFDFLAELSVNALPYLDKSKEELADIDSWQSDKFPFRKQYINSEQYFETINLRKEKFLNYWPNIKWQEWNYAGDRSYKKLESED